MAAAALALLGTRFSHPGLEDAYRDYCVSSGLVREDMLAVVVRAVIILAGSFRGLLQGALASPVMGAGVLLAAPLTQYMLGMRCLREPPGTSSRARFLRDRAAVTAIFRILTVPLASMVVISPGGNPSLSLAFSAAWFCLRVVAPGIAAMGFLTLTSGLLLEEHLPVQAFLVGLVVLTRGKSFCSRAVESPAGAGGALAVWRWLDARAWSVVSVMYGGVVDDAVDVIAPRAEEACMHVLSEAYLVLGLVGLTYVVWALERRSRTEFLARLGGEWPWVWGSEGGWWAPVGGWGIMAHAAMAPVWMAVSWQVLGLAVLGPESRCRVTGGCPRDGGRGRAEGGIVIEGVLDG
eukprot:evm.model.scf_839.2 EVM.evm.TU.scf_839.2   scf_839:12788-13864(+)